MRCLRAGLGAHVPGLAGCKSLHSLGVVEIGGRDWLAGWRIYAESGLGVADEQGTWRRGGWGAGLHAEATGAAAYAKRGQIQQQFPGVAERLRDA